MNDERTTLERDVEQGLHCSYSTIPELILLLKQLRLNDPTVKQVCIQWRKLPAAYLDTFFSLLAENTFVTHVTLAQCHITDAVVCSFTKFIRYNRTVIDLDLSRNHLSDVSAEHIANALIVQPSSSSSSLPQPTLRKLTLQGNQFTAIGINTICAAISRTHIQVLKIGKMILGEVGAVGVANMLMDTACPLRKLDIRSSQLGSMGVSIIGPALAVNQLLEVLCLGKNNIEDDAICILANALQRNVSLRTLDVQYNPITNVGANHFVHCLDDNNYTLRKLKLRHCDAITNDMKEMLLDILVMNSYGPELAFKTKNALRSVLVEESTSNSNSISDYSINSRTDEDDIIRQNNNDNDDTDVYPTTTINSSSCHIQTSTPPPPPPTGTGTGVSTPSTVVSATKKYHEEMCVICYENLAECILLPCRHRNCCTHCAHKLKSCHMCREVIVKVFLPT